MKLHHPKPSAAKVVVYLGTLLAIELVCVATSTAAIQTVSYFGEGGWKSDDTRTSAGVDLVGINSTHAGKPGTVPSAADDTVIAQQIQFVNGPAGSTYGGAVSIWGTSASAGKSQISVIDSVNGFGTLDSSFTATYEMYKQHTGSGSTLAFKLGVQSTAWGTDPGESQNGFVATRSGESVWDLVLVHVPTVANNVWTTINLDSATGLWSLFRQAGNTFFPAPGSAKTLNDWFSDATFGTYLSDATVSSVQFGLGSSQPVAYGYVDYLQTNLLSGGDVINFAPVPEPGSALIWGLIIAVGSVATAYRRWGR
jgi:hypothetical protein